MLNNKYISLSDYSFDQKGKELLRNSYIKYVYGAFREVDSYTHPELIVPWLRQLISQNRSIYPEAMALFPDNQLWNNILNINDNELTEQYREDYSITESYMNKGIHLPEPTSAKDCAFMYLNNIFSSKDIILDVGSGSGSFLNYSGVLPFQELMGVEIRKDLHEINLANIQNNPLLHPQNSINVYHGDVRERIDLISRANTFYIFNSIGQELLKDLLELIKLSKSKNPRSLKLVYCNAVHGKTISRQKWLERISPPLNNGKIYVWESI